MSHTDSVCVSYQEMKILQTSYIEVDIDYDILRHVFCLVKSNYV